MPINWALIDRHSFPGKIFRWPLSLIPKETMLTIRQGPAKGLKWKVGSSTHGCWLGTYELNKQEALLRFVKTGMTVYDIGAQAGFYTLFFSTIISKKGIVYAFEPFPENVRNLLLHLEVNRINNIRVYMAALGCKNGFSGFSTNRGITENCLTEKENSLLTVPSNSLDHLVGNENLLPPSLIKIDVEGAEYQVLTGGEEILKKFRPIVFLALHGTEQRQFCLPFLKKLGYAIFNLKGNIVKNGEIVDEIYALPDS